MVHWLARIAQIPDRVAGAQPTELFILPFGLVNEWVPAWGNLGKVNCSNVGVTHPLFQVNWFLPTTDSSASETEMSPEATHTIAYVPIFTFYLKRNTYKVVLQTSY